MRVPTAVLVYKYLLLSEADSDDNDDTAVATLVSVT